MNLEQERLRSGACLYASTTVESEGSAKQSKTGRNATRR
jgi:hypothetical protein